MPLTYEEYKKNKEIQPTLAGLEIDSDKFWFLLLFILDYTQGQCFNAQELAPSPIGELNSLIKLLSQYKAVGENPLTDQMQFSEDITLSIQINGKEVQTIQHPNTLVTCCPYVKRVSITLRYGIGRYDSNVRSSLERYKQHGIQ